MIRITPGACRVQITGHAGAAEPGKDPVCAAVSGLVLTLAENVKEISGIRCRIVPGDAFFQCPETEENRKLFTVFFRGFRLLSRLYPEYIKMEEEQ